MLQKFNEVLKWSANQRKVLKVDGECADNIEKGYLYLDGQEWMYDIILDKDAKTATLLIENLDTTKRIRMVMKNIECASVDDTVDEIVAHRLNTSYIMRLLAMTKRSYTYENKRRHRIIALRKEQQKYREANAAKHNAFKALIAEQKLKLRNSLVNVTNSFITEINTDEIIRWTSNNRGYGNEHWGSYAVDAICDIVRCITLEDVPSFVKFVEQKFAELLNKTRGLSGEDLIPFFINYGTIRYLTEVPEQSEDEIRYRRTRDITEARHKFNSIFGAIRDWATHCDTNKLSIARFSYLVEATYAILKSVAGNEVATPQSPTVRPMNNKDGFVSVGSVFDGIKI